MEKLESCYALEWGKGRRGKGKWEVLNALRLEKS